MVAFLPDHALSAAAPEMRRAILAAEAGARVLRTRYQHPITHTTGSLLDFSTDADLASEVEIVRRLRTAFPRHGIFAEESGWVLGGPEHEHQWLVDPLCGTLNFAAGIPAFCVNVALTYLGQPVLGVMVHPLSRELLFAAQGAPAYRTIGREPPRLAHTSRDSRIIALDFAKPVADGYVNETLTLALDPKFNLQFVPRAMGTSLALGYVALGRLAGFVAYSPGDVHFAAGVVLCRAAGAAVTDLDGAEWRAGAAGIIAAADRETHLQLIGVVRASLRRRGQERLSRQA